MKSALGILAALLLVLTACSKNEEAPPPSDGTAEIAAANIPPEVALGDAPADPPPPTEPTQDGVADPTPVPMNPPPPAPTPKTAGPDVNKLPIAKAYAAIWKSKDKAKALAIFQKKNGLPLMTTKQMGKTSVLAEQGSCGEKFISLVKNAKPMSESVWEIDAKGKTLRQWQSGSMDILGIEKNTLYRKVQFFETLGDFDPFRQGRNTRTHDFVLAVGSDSSLKVLPAKFKLKNKWVRTETKCPAGLKIKSEDKYCVKEKKSKRMFVLQRPCT